MDHGRSWMETEQRTKVGFLFLLKTSGTDTPDGRSRNCGTLGKSSHPSEPQLPGHLCTSTLPGTAQAPRESILTVLIASNFGHRQLARHVPRTISFHLDNKTLSVPYPCVTGEEAKTQRDLSHWPRIPGRKEPAESETPAIKLQNKLLAKTLPCLRSLPILRQTLLSTLNVFSPLIPTWPY